MGAEKGNKDRSLPRVLTDVLSPEDLDKIMEEGDAGSVEGERKTSKAEAQRRRRVPLESSSADDTGSDSATGKLCLLQVNSMGIQ